MSPATPFPGSQCHGCRHLRLNRNARGSVFLQCQHPELPKYLPQPVQGCAGYQPAAREGEAPNPT